MDKINVVKIGGSLINDEKSLNKFIIQFDSLEGKKILIHGGGKEANLWLKKLGIPVKMNKGRRITDSKTLDVITAIYGGLINKAITSKFQKIKDNYIGLSGIDGNLIYSKKRDKKETDYGFVGDIIKINTDLILNLIHKNYIPIICPLSHNKNGQILNVNADTVSTEIAIELSKKFEVNSYFCFEMKGVMKNIKEPNSLIERIDMKIYKSLLNNNIVSDGMIPKIDNAFYGLKNGIKNIFIGSPEMISGETKFTKIVL